MRHWIRGVTVCLLVCWGSAGVAAQEIVWQRTHGPGGGFVHNLDQGPNGDLFAIVSGLHSLNTHLYRSVDGGDTWEDVAGVPERIAQVAVSRAGVWFALRAERAIFSSRDEGQTWSRLAFPGFPTVLGFDAAGRLVAGASGGVYRSPDEGASWERRGLDGLYVRAITAAGAGRLLAVTRDGMYLTTDDGATWQAVAGPRSVGGLLGLPSGEAYVGIGGIAGFSEHNIGVYSLQDDSLVFAGLDDVSVGAFAVDNTGRLFAGTSGRCVGFVCLAPAGLYRSEDGGAIWQAAGLSSTSVVAVLVTARGELLAGTQPLFRDAGVGLPRGLVRSSDAGATWEQASRGVGHAVPYALVPAPDGTLYAAADHSVFRYRSGGSWQPIYTTVLGDSIAPYYHLAVHPDGDLFVLAYPYEDYDVFSPQPYSEGRLLHSADQGATWTTLRTGFFERLVVTSRGTLLVASDGALLRSEDRGVTWTRIDGIWAGETLTFVPSPDGTLFAAVRGEDGALRLHRTTDDGVTWIPEVEVGRSVSVEHLTLVATAPDTLYAAFDSFNRVTLRLVETDEQWTIDELGQAPLPMDNLAADADGVLYTIGSRYTPHEGQLLTSEDGGDTWTTRGAGLEELQIPLIALGPDRSLYAVTESEGVFRGVPPGPTTVEKGAEFPEVIVEAASYPNPFQAQTTLAFTLTRPAAVTLTVYDVLGRQIASLLSGVPYPVGHHTVPWKAAGHPSGVYVFHLTAGASLRSGRMIVLK